MKTNKTYSTEELKNLQLTLLEILKEIDSICHKHNIKYAALAGTLLGAHRHNDFIPWDDDVDIGMLREDYDRFIEVAKTELDNRYFVLNFDVNNQVPFSFTKICKRETLFVESEVKNLKYPHCVFVDIMPLDKCPDDDRLAKKHFKKMEFYHQLFKSKMLWKVSKTVNGSRANIGNIVRPLLHILLFFVPKKCIYSKLMRIMKKYNADQSSNHIYYWLGYKSYWHLKDYQNLKTLKFNDLDLYVPSNHEKLLEKEYGDFMSLPPVEKRQSHSPEILKL